MGTAAAVVGGSVVGGVLSSRSQRKAADKQADAIKDGQKISSEAAAQAREDVLASYAPAFKDIAMGVQNARNDLLSGRVTSQDILNRSFSQAGNTLQTSTQAALNALAGSPQVVSNQMQPTRQLIGEKSQLRDIRKESPRKQIEEIQSRESSVSGIKYKPIESFEGNNKAQQREVESDPYLSRKDKDKLIKMARYSEEGNIKGFGKEYNRMTGGEFQSLGQAKEAFENEQILSGVSPDVSGGIEGPTFMQTHRFGVQAPAGEYGLSSAESALRQSERRQLGEFSRAADQATDLVGSGARIAVERLKGSRDQQLSALRSGAETARGDIERYADESLGFYSPYRQAGEGALEREAALTGAMGPEAQARAFAQYEESPGQKYLREQQEKALLRSSAAIGGLGGGNVRTALQEQAAGIASQNYQQDLENLRSLAGRGQQAAGASAGITQQAGSNLANIANQLGMNEAQVRAATGQSIAQIQQETGMTQAQIQQMLGQQRAGTIGQAGQQISGLRYGTGQDISRMLAGAGGQYAGMQQGLGSNLSNIDQQTAANLANLSAQYGQQLSGLRTGLGSTLANIGVGQGSQQANLATQLGSAQAAGVTNPIGNIASRLTGLVAYKPSLFGLGD